MTEQHAKLYFGHVEIIKDLVESYGLLQPDGM